MPECSKLELENYFLSLFISFFLFYHHSMLRLLRTPINAIVIYNSRLFLFVYRPPAESDNPRNIANG